MKTEILSEITPFLQEYWPVIITGLMCLIAAVALIKTSLSNSSDDIPSDSDDGDLENDFDFENTDVCALPTDFNQIPLDHKKLSPQESLKRSLEFYELMKTRRTVKTFSPESFPIEIIHNIIKAAGTAPSGAHSEPWTYIVVTDAALKKRIRDIIEHEEKTIYSRKSGSKALNEILSATSDKMKFLFEKEYITSAPYLILVFKQMYTLMEDGTKKVHYYNEMSVAIAAGILLTAIHYSGLVSLTSTPVSCGPDIREVLNRPQNERLSLLVPVGYPATGSTVPDLPRKSVHEIMVEM